MVKLTQAGELFYEESKEVLARAEKAVQSVRKHHRVEEKLRIAYSPSATAGILPRALAEFQKTCPHVRVDLVDVNGPEIIRLATEERLDIIISLEPSVATTPGYEWSDFRCIQTVLVMRADHPLTRYKRIAPKLLRDLPLVGLGQANFPSYVPHVRKSLKQLGFDPHFVALEEDGVPTLFASVEAYNAAAILADTVAEFLPRSLVWRPFHPRFDPVIARIGVSLSRPSALAQAFVEIIRAI